MRHPGQLRFNCQGPASQRVLIAYVPLECRPHPDHHGRLLLAFDCSPACKTGANCRPVFERRKETFVLCAIPLKPRTDVRIAKAQLRSDYAGALELIALEPRARPQKPGKARSRGGKNDHRNNHVLPSRNPAFA